MLHRVALQAFGKSMATAILGLTAPAEDVSALPGLTGKPVCRRVSDYRILARKEVPEG